MERSRNEKKRGREKDKCGMKKKGEGQGGRENNKREFEAAQICVYSDVRYVKIIDILTLTFDLSTLRLGCE